MKRYAMSKDRCTQLCKDDKSTQITYEFKANLINIPIGSVMKCGKVILKCMEKNKVLRTGRQSRRKKRRKREGRKKRA